MQLRTQKANFFRRAKRFSQKDMAVQSCTKSSVGIRMRKSLCPSNHAMQLPRPCTESTAQAFYSRNGYRETGYRMRLSSVEQEILICNGEFDKREFRRFLALYSNGTVWPKIWRQEICGLPR